MSKSLRRDALILKKFRVIELVMEHDMESINADTFFGSSILLNISLSDEFKITKKE